MHSLNVAAAVTPMSNSASLVAKLLLETLPWAVCARILVAPRSSSREEIMTTPERQLSCSTQHDGRPVPVPGLVQKANATWVIEDPASDHAWHLISPGMKERLMLRTRS